MLKKLKLRELILIIYIFLGVFNPDIFPVETINVLFLCSLLYILVHIIHDKVIIAPKEIKKIISIFLLFFCYVTFSLIIHFILDSGNASSYVTNVTVILGVFLRSFVLYYAMYIYANKCELSVEHYFKYIIVVGFIQTICVVLSMMFPTVRSFFNSFTINNSGDLHLISYILTNSQRCYGFANNLFDSFGYTTAIIISITFVYSIGRNTKLLFLYVPMLIMPFMNTRTGILLVLITTIFTCIYYSKKTSARGLIKYVLIIPAGAIIISTLFRFLPEQTMEWIQKGIDSIIVLITEKRKIAGFDTIGSMTGLPEDLLFGMAASPELLSLGATDVGYVQCIWRFGLIGTIILLLGYVYIFFTMYKCSRSKEEKCISLVLGIIFYVYLYKLYSIGNMCGNFLIYTILAIYISNGSMSRRKYE